MATIDKTGDAPTAEKIPFEGLDVVYVLGNTVDLTGEAITEGDVYKCLTVPDNTHVFQVKIIMITPAVGTTLTATAGDGNDGDGWGRDQDHKGGFGTVFTSAAGTDAYATGTLGTFYDCADSIDVTYRAADGITAGPKFRIIALCVDFNSVAQHGVRRRQRNGVKRAGIGGDDAEDGVGEGAVQRESLWRRHTPSRRLSGPVRPGQSRRASYERSDRYNGAWSGPHRHGG